MATVDVPFADVSAMDGYALAGPVGTDKPLPVRGTIAAGAPPGDVLDAGDAFRIMTGAPVPHGADRVVPVELTDGGDKTVILKQLPDGGAHIRRRAEVHAEGDLLLQPRTQLTAGTLALLATHGIADVEVVGVPKIAILTTGDEVVAPEVTPQAGQLRDSHTTFLTAAVATLGLEATSLGIAPDNPEALRTLIAKGLDYDILLLGGGVSMGVFDYVEGVLESLGAKFLFTSVAIQPGKPMVAAKTDRTLILGLPGNPASVMACFWLFARPAIRRMMGLDDGFWHGALRATLTARLPEAKARDRYLPASIAFRRGEIMVHPLRPKGSHDLAAFGRGTALVRIKAHADAREAGDPCEILPLVNWTGG
jgi:molybdopterin molybdotransferase